MDTEKPRSALRRTAEKAQRIRRPQTREAKIIFSLIYLFFNLLIITVISFIEQSIPLFIILFIGTTIIYYLFRFLAAFLSAFLWSYVAYEILWHAQSEVFIQSVLLNGFILVLLFFGSLFINLLLVTLGLRKPKSIPKK